MAGPRCVAQRQFSVRLGCCCARPECRMTQQVGATVFTRTPSAAACGRSGGAAPRRRWAESRSSAARLAHRVGRASASSFVARAQGPLTVLARPEPLFCACPLTSWVDRLCDPPSFLPSAAEMGTCVTRGRGASSPQDLLLEDAVLMTGFQEGKICSTQAGLGLKRIDGEVNALSRL